MNSQKKFLSFHVKQVAYVNNWLDYLLLHVFPYLAHISVTGIVQRDRAITALLWVYKYTPTVIKLMQVINTHKTDW